MNKRNMKINKTIMGWLVVIFIIAPGAVFLINLFFFPQNKVVEKDVDFYINNSSTIELDMANNANIFKYIYSNDQYDYMNCDFKSHDVYTGLQTAFLRGKLTEKWVRNMIFYNNAYQKYFSLTIIPEKTAQCEAYYACIRDKPIFARINNFEMNSPDYGTRDNPVPIFMLEIPGVRDPDFLEAVITEDQYRRTVSFYLTHMMPKKEFKERFEK